MYPGKAKLQLVTGTIYIRFVVGEDGKVLKSEIKRSINSPNIDAVDLLEEEVNRVIISMPSWKPGEHKGKKVPVYITIPINFALK